MNNLMKKISIFIFVFLMLTPFKLSAQVIETQESQENVVLEEQEMVESNLTRSSRIDYHASHLYAGLLTQGTLPSTNHVNMVLDTVVLKDDKGHKVNMEPRQQNWSGSWVKAGSSCTVTNSGSCSRSLSEKKPTKLFIKTGDGMTVEAKGHFTT